MIGLEGKKSKVLNRCCVVLCCVLFCLSDLTFWAGLEEEEAVVVVEGEDDDEKENERMTMTNDASGCRCQRRRQRRIGGRALRDYYKYDRLERGKA